MTHKPSGVAAAHAAACDIGLEMNDDERIARQFHATYERLSAEYGYHTRLDTREFDPESPNGRLMIATVREVITGDDVAALVPLVRRLMKAIQYVSMPPCDCNQSEVYDLMDRINVILDVPQESGGGNDA